MQTRAIALFCFLASILSLIISGLLCLIYAHEPIVYQTGLALTVGLFAAYLYLDHKRIRAQFKKKTSRYGAASFSMSLLAIGVMVLVNLIASEHNVVKDVTSNQAHSLSDQTTKVLEGLTEKVVLRPVVDSASQQPWKEAFENYRLQSPLIELSFLDPDLNPIEIKQYKISKKGSVVVESNQRVSIVENPSQEVQGLVEDPGLEGKLVNAIIKVSKGRKKKIYFTEGHGEKSLDSDKAEDLSLIKVRLDLGRYEVDKLMLPKAQQIPEDADVIAMVGPKAKLFPHELSLLENYLQKGGKLLVLLDPKGSGEMTGFLQKLGVVYDKDYGIVELNPVGGTNQLTPLVMDYGAHPITETMGAQLTVFPVATPLKTTPSVPAGFKISPLLSTSKLTFRVKIPDSGRVDMSLKEPGPYQLGYAVEGTVKGASDSPSQKDTKTSPGASPMRLVVVGDSDFMSNKNHTAGANMDLFENMLSWLAMEEDLIAVRPRPVNLSKLEITQNQAVLIYYASILGLPLLLIFLGIGVWVYRRRL